MWPLLTNVGMMCSHDRADEEYFPFRVKETTDCLLCAVDMFSQGGREYLCFTNEGIRVHRSQLTCSGQTVNSGARMQGRGVY